MHQNLKFLRRQNLRSVASGGCPWTVILVESCETYMKALEDASVKQDIEAFAKFISHLVKRSMKGKPVAKI